MNPIAMWVGGLLLGVGITLSVFSSYLRSQDTTLRTQMVELGVGYYDSGTGEFQLRKCSK